MTLHGYYSQEASYRFGEFSWHRNLQTGAEVMVTCVFTDQRNDSAYRWPDAVYVGLVGPVLRKVTFAPRRVREQPEMLKAPDERAFKARRPSEDEAIKEITQWANRMVIATTPRMTEEEKAAVLKSMEEVD